MSSPPEIRYAKSGDAHLAYHVFGEGDLDLVVVAGFFSHLELMWDFAPARRFLERLGRFARVINFDRRGTGLSDPAPSAPPLEVRMDDVRAVMDAAGSERAALFGLSEGASMCILYAATHPEKVQALVCYGAVARATYAEDYPWAAPREALEEAGGELIMPLWGTGATVELGSPSRADDPEVRNFYARAERMSVTPAMMASLAEMFMDVDVRDVASTVNVPTLLLHRTKDHLVNVRHSRWLAENMPAAKLVELPGIDHNLWFEHSDAIVDEIEEFLTGSRSAPEPSRVLATVVFTDIVESTQTAARLGDASWREVLERHDRAVREQLERFGGRAVKSTGDGFLATFDGPARAIRSAQAIEAAGRELGIAIRAGLHTGECEVLDGDIGGIAVHIASRVSGLADGGEVLVSRTVKDLVAGSGIEFSDRGEHELKGIPDRWSIYAVTN